MYVIPSTTLKIYEMLLSTRRSNQSPGSSARNLMEDSKLSFEMESGGLLAQPDSLLNIMEVENDRESD
jgi:hypothetical protein